MKGVSNSECGSDGHESPQGWASGARLLLRSTGYQELLYSQLHKAQDIRATAVRPFQPNNREEERKINPCPSQAVAGVWLWQQWPPLAADCKVSWHGSERQ